MTQIVRTTEVPCVVDADALNLLVGRLEVLESAHSVRVLTSSRGVRAADRTLDRRGPGLAGEPGGPVRSAAPRRAGPQRSGTIITDGQRITINQTGNPGMATGGTGDVLTGLITSLIAQGANPFDAACLGCHLHGLAGDLAAEELSPPGLIASDLPRFLPQAWRRLSRHADTEVRPNPLSRSCKNAIGSQRSLQRKVSMNFFRATLSDVARFRDDGYVIVRGLLTPEEVDLLNKVARADKHLAETAYGRQDAKGAVVTLAVRNDLNR